MSDSITPELEPREWLIRKRGYYYRPNRAGYTASVAEAGRYTEAEAKAEANIEPKIMSAVHELEVEGGGVSSNEIASIREEWERRAGSRKAQYRLSHAKVGTLLSKLIQQEGEIDRLKMAVSALRPADSKIA